ncbi:hypothetical protein MRB53_015076 [Persea americana]|uniref:Uncharacterized protein n=1 Tax=Persea americana TaxID=3435 RepID=A0ACC2KCP6_PERAE|nr:hypothetical protein MRB53_015076 [Persea americana]
MSDSSRKMDADRLLSFSDDLIQVLKNRKDINALMRSLDDAKKLRSSADAELSDLHDQLNSYQKRINACKQNIEEAETEVVADAELDRLQVSVEERKGTLMKAEKDEMRQQKKLSMYASVTNIIPDLVDKTRISGQIVDRDKKMVEKFDFDPTKTSAVEICSTLWKLMDL